MPDRALVADASALGALIFQEPRASEAAGLLRGARLFAPTLLAHELASIARKKILKSPAARPLILKALGLGLNLDIAWLEPDYAAVVSLALSKGLTTYDAAYLWTAETQGIPLATFDARLEAAAISRP